MCATRLQRTLNPAGRPKFVVAEVSGSLSVVTREDDGDAAHQIKPDACGSVSRFGSSLQYHSGTRAWIPTMVNYEKDIAAIHRRSRACLLEERTQYEISLSPLRAAIL